MNARVSPQRLTVSGAILCVAMLIITVTLVYGQVAGASLTGVVTDSSGGVVPTATISIKDLGTGVVRVLTTDTAGLYVAPNLAPGSYQVSISAQGFETQVNTGVTLTVAAQVVLDVKLLVGTIQQQIQVTTETPTVELADSTIGATVTGTTVRELPLNGRSWTDLATLQPGVGAIEAQPAFNIGSNRGNRGFGNQITVAGARPTDNNYRLDGISLNDWANAGPGSVLGGNLGVDAIQEFSVSTTNSSAEYGKTSGGVINAVSRSGSNSFHGSVYEFLRNSALDARNFFDASQIPAFRRNQFGAAAGGPIKKGQTFFFADYEGLRQSKGVSTVDTVPSVAARAGHLSTGTVTVDPQAAKYLAFWPVPPSNATTLAGGDLAIFTFAAPEVVSENFLLTRIDHKISAKDALNGTYMYDDSGFTVPDSLDTQLFGSHIRRQVIGIEETHLFSSTFVNSLRAGFNREAENNNRSVSAINPLAANSSLGAAPGQFAAGVSIGGGVTTFQGGLNAFSTALYDWNSFQGYDDASWTFGRHSVKFGGAVERMQLNMLFSSLPGGQWAFPSLSAFLTNQPSKFTAALSNAVSPRNLRQTLFGGYISDDWRVRPNLTLNLGLRYEMTTVPTEVNDKLAWLNSFTDPTPNVGNPLYHNPTLRNFEPRVGFSWDPFRDGKTAIRAGFGMFDVLPLIYQFTDLQARGTPFYLLGTLGAPPAGTFYSGGFPLLGVSSLRTAFIQRDPKRDYVMQWNLNVQREVIPNLTVSVGYVGLRGVHQPYRVDDMDEVIPTLTPYGYLFPSPAGSGTRVNPAFGVIGGLFYSGSSSYNGLEVGVQKKISHGLQIQSSFTWAKGFDDNSSVSMGNQYNNSLSDWWNWFNPRASRGVSDFNIGRTLVINGIWDVPGRKSASRLMSLLVNGWQLGAIFKVSDGLPFTATLGSGGDPLGVKDNSPLDFPDIVRSPACSSLVNPGNYRNYIKTQCFTLPTVPSQAFYTANCDPKFAFPVCINLAGNSGRNTLTGPGLSNLDFSLFKNIPVKKIAEAFNVQFRVEAFNILNHTNFQVPSATSNTDIFTANGSPNAAAGLLTSTTTDSREIQFGLKLTW